MAVNVDAQRSAQVVGGATSVTIPAFLVSGLNRFIFVGVAVSTGPEAIELTSTVVRNGTESFQEIWDVTPFTDMHNSGHYFVAPAVGSFSIVCTVAAIQDELAAGAISFTGVHQTSPIGTHGTASGTGTTASVTVTAADDEILVDVAHCFATPITVGAGQTMQTQQLNINGAAAGWSTQFGDVASDVMTWTQGSSTWTIGAVPVKPAVVTSPMFTGS